MSGYRLTQHMSQSLKEAATSTEKDLSRQGFDAARWLGNWVSGTTYQPYSMVLDDEWLMCSNKATAERPAPQPVGTAQYIYDGLSPIGGTLAKQVIFGNRYTASTLSFQVSKIRIYTVIGNEYAIIVVRDPLGTPIFDTLASFTATVDGWAEFNYPATIIPEGNTFDVIAVVQEPDPTPTTFANNWNYVTPNNPANPAVGQIVHANSTLGILSVHKTSEGGDESANLATITVGDIIDAGGIRWAVQSVTDQTTHYDFGISPALQDAPDGSRLFTFETVTATPITVMNDTDYWLAHPSSTQGIIAVDTDYANATINDTAYGIDIFVQEVQKSDDWDIMAISSGTASSQVDVANYTGWASYQDSVFNSGNKKVVNNATVQLTNDAGAGTNTDYLPTPAGSPVELWSGDRITPIEEGDTYQLRVDFQAEGVGLDDWFDLLLDIGSPSGIVIVTRTISLTKTGVNSISVSFPIFTLGTFLANGGGLWIDTTPSGDNVSVWDFNLFIKRNL